MLTRETVVELSGLSVWGKSVVQVTVIIIGLRESGLRGRYNTRT